MFNATFNDYSNLPMEGINEPHMPVILVCDRSISMEGRAIDNLNLAVNRFAADICRDDPKVARCVDVAVISFNENTQVEQDWRPITELQPVNLQASGNTNISKALNLAVQKLRERTRIYEDNGIEVKMPYVILITDGKGGDVTEVAKLIHERTDAKKMQLWILCVKGYDGETVAKLSRGERVFELVDDVGFDFTEFFDFMKVSIKAVSLSAPGERIRIDEKDNPFKKKDSNLQVPDLDDWLNS